MLTKVVSISKSFRRSCQYLCQDQDRSRVLDMEGVRGHDYKLMADDFEEQRQLRPGREKPLLHLCLSFSPLEQPEDTLMAEIGRKYLERIGMVNTQYAMVRHTDRPHAHMHIIVNVVNNDGKSLDLGWIRLRTLKVARELTKEYKLIPTNKKNLDLTHRENFWGSDVERYQIYEAIGKSLPHCGSLEELEKQLLPQGISVKYRYNENTNERIGISFRLGKQCFAGGKVDREFTIKELERTFALRLEQKQELRQRQSQGLRRHF